MLFFGHVAAYGSVGSSCLDSGKRGVLTPGPSLDAQRMFRYCMGARILFFLQLSSLSPASRKINDDNERNKQGEWLSYTAYAEVAGHWDVVASVASGVENSVNTFRILANATNCTTMTANGTDGMGATGVDLLGGPASFGYTGSWEAFTLTGAEEVWIPAGTHRILFCVDTPMFNLNYLRVYIPVPTPAPTMAPTPVPTAAPIMPDDSGSPFTLIYISVSPGRELCDDVRVMIGALWFAPGR